MILCATSSRNMAHAQRRFSTMTWSFGAEYLGNRYRCRLGSKGPPIGKGPMPSQMVTWPMTSRDPEKSRLWPHWYSYSATITYWHTTSRICLEIAAPFGESYLCSFAPARLSQCEAMYRTKFEVYSWTSFEDMFDCMPKILEIRDLSHAHFRENFA